MERHMAVSRPAQTPQFGLQPVGGERPVLPEDYNKLMRRFDFFVRPRVLDADFDEQPLEPNDGAAYLLGSDLDGDAEWEDQAEGTIAYFNATLGAWEYFVPVEGQIVYDLDEGEFLWWDGEAWQPLVAEGDGGEG